MKTGIFTSEWTYTERSDNVVTWNDTPMASGTPLAIRFENVLIDLEGGMLELLKQTCDSYELMSYLNIVQGKHWDEITRTPMRHNIWLSTRYRRTYNALSLDDFIHLSPVNIHMLEYLYTLQELEYPYFIVCNDERQYNRHQVSRILMPRSVTETDDANKWYSFTLSDTGSPTVIYPRVWNRSLVGKRFKQTL